MLSGNLRSQKMSLTLPKNKKLLLYFAFGLAGFLLALQASASGYNTPTYDNVFFQVPSDIDGGFKISDNVSSASYMAGATKYTPALNRKLCEVGAKISRIGDAPENNRTIWLRIYKDLAKPSFLPLSDHTDEAFWVENRSSAEYPLLSTYLDIYGRIASESVGYTYLTIKSKNQSETCVTLEAQHTYWFTWQLETPAPYGGTYFGWASDYPLFTSWVRDTGDSTNTWHYLIDGKTWSFELRNDLTGGTTYLPPATASYGFENKDFGLLGNMFRDVIVWLFFPDQANLERFGNLWDTIRLKPPIGYFTAAKDELGLVSVGSASITFDTTAAAGIITPLRTGIIVILWVLFAFWIFHRLRNLDL